LILDRWNRLLTLVEYYVNVPATVDFARAFINKFHAIVQRNPEQLDFWSICSICDPRGPHVVSTSRHARSGRQ
jgi:hypothetical protein